MCPTHHCYKTLTPERLYLPFTLNKMVAFTTAVTTLTILSVRFHCEPSQLLEKLGQLNGWEDGLAILKTYRFTPTYGRRGSVLRVFGFSGLSADEQPMRVGSGQSVADYFWRYRRIFLSYPKLPCIHTVDSVGQFYQIPPELLVAVSNRTHYESVLTYA